MNLSVQHAPGYPAITLLGRLCTTLPIGGITFRVNLLAALLAAGCAVALASTVHRLIPGRAGLAAGIVAGGWFAISRIVWECALSAKGAIYLFNLLLLALATRSLLAGRRGVLLASALTGAALGGHWMTAIWWLPVIAHIGRPWTGRRAGLALLVLATGASLTLALPLCAGREPAWGDAGHLAGLGEILLRRTFLPQAALKPGWLTAAQLGDGLFAPVREGGIVWLLLGVAGLVAGRRLRPGAVGALVVGPLLSLGAVAVMANPVHLASGELILWLTDRFHLPWLLAVGIGAGIGLGLLDGALPSRARMALWMTTGIIVATGAARRAGPLDHARDYLGWDFAGNIRAHITAATSPGSGRVTVLAEADYQSFPVFVPLHLDAALPGTRLIITNPFLDRPGGWQRLARSTPEAAGLDVAGGRLTGAPDAAAESRILVLIDRLRESGPVLHLPMCSYPGVRARLIPAGLLHEIGAAAQPPPLGRAPNRAASVRVPPLGRLRWRGVTATSPARDAAAWSVLDVYGLTRIAHAGTAFRDGQFDVVAAACERALPYTGGFGRAYLLTTLGHARARQQRYPEAESAFRAAARLKPRDPDLWTNVATACAAQGRTGEALALFDRVLRRHPRHAGALANLRMLHDRLAAGLSGARRPPI